MAQAARLNLRMQKELKLLLAEPPPAASFPLLSSDSNFSSFSLSSIDALIEGPEGTVYEKRLFKIKIQIPERYPFQPPTVTFNTPIYHPNIDNGGRICLDILNLPPKGAWQPSLNISTVLTSIGLLLSEPNPDDGLMCDASREYKYNRQAFDEKARSMTQKFGMVGARGDSSGCNSLQSNLNSNTIEAQTSETTKCDESNLPLGFSESNEKPNHMEIELEKQESKDMLNEGHPKYERGQKSRLKLSLESFGPSQFVRGDDKENVVLNQNLSPSTSQSVSTTSTKSINTGQRSGYYYEKQQMVPQDFNKQAREDYSKKNETALANPKRKKLGLTGKKLPLGLSRSCHSLENSNKENSTLTQTIPISHPSNISKSEVSGCFDDKTVKCSTNLDQRKLGIGRTLSLKPLSRVQRTSDAKSQLQLHSEGDEIHHGDKEESPAPEAVIVLDSEESEEERDGPLRSKLILARKRLPKKWRAQK